MGSCNFAEISIDATSGFVSIHSRHKLNVDQRKIFGAVAILLVEPDGESKDEHGSSDVEICEPNSLQNIYKQSDVTGKFNGRKAHPIITVPSSLSLIDSPCGGMGGLSSAAPSFDSRNQPSANLSEHQSASGRSGNHSNQSVDQMQDSNQMEMDHESNLYLSHSSHRSVLHTQTSQEPNVENNIQSDVHTHVGESEPSKNVSVIDLSDVPINRFQNPVQEKANLVLPTDDISTSPVKEHKHMRNASGEQMHTQHVSTSLLSRMNQISKRKQRKTKISTLLKQQKNQKINESKCYVCGEALSSFKENEMHCARHSLPSQCTICGMKFMVPSNLRRHFSGHIHIIAYTCPFCSAMYRRKDNLSTHIFQKHNIKSWNRKSQQILSKLGTPGRQPVGQSKRQQLKISQDKKKDITPNSKQLSTDTLCSRQSTVVSPAHTLDYRSNPSDSSLVQSNTTSHNIGVASPIEIKEEPVYAGSEENTQLTRESPTRTLDTWIAEHTTGISHSVPDPNLEQSNDDSNFVPRHGHTAISSSSILNYSCSTCNVKFPQLDELKQHVISVHSENIPQQLPVSTENLDVSNVASSQTESMFLCTESQGKSKLDYGGNSEQFSNLHGRLDQSDDFQNMVIDKSVPINSPYDHQSSCSEASVSDTLVNEAYPNYLHSSGFQNMETNGDNVSFVSGGEAISFIHTGRKKITKGNSKCTICGMLLASWEAILDHGEQHKQILCNFQSPDMFANKFHCVVCHTVLGTKDSLRRHAINHMGVQHFCTMCTAVYSRKDNLLKHMRECHGVHTPRS